MNDDATPAAAPAIVDLTPEAAAPQAAPPPAAALAAASVPTASLLRWAAAVVAVLAVLTLLALFLAWKADQRIRGTERELVRRQQESAERVAEANLLAKQAQEGMRDAAAKLALLEARVGEVAVQRGQLEELVQSVTRTRDENLVADVEAAMRTAWQQAALTGSAEPVVAALQQSDERLTRAEQPRLEPLRRAIAHDLERTKAASLTDVATLSIRIDEAVRLIDELPLLSAAEPRRDVGRRLDGTAPPAAPDAAASAGADSLGAMAAQFAADAGQFLVDHVWSEIRSLVRITRIDHPEAMLMAPEQAFFLKENLKLRLLNARLALLARQFDSAQSDVQYVQAAVDRYFDRAARRTQGAVELLAQIAQQARRVGVPRPDETFAALAAAAPR